MPEPQPGEIVLLISPDLKRFLVRLEPGAEQHTHRGYVKHDDIIGCPTGRVVLSHSGQRFTVLRPSMEELLTSVRRATQIVYPKDAGYILLKLDVVPGKRVVEAGSGSGAFTVALARYVTPGGHVFSYEIREDMHNLARNNVAHVGLDGAVTFHHQSIEDGIHEREVDAVFLDVREPWLYLEQAADSMAGGAFLGAIVPTVNQMVTLTTALQRRERFVDLEVGELMLRRYKTVPERVRPMDRMTAHTGFLLFARRVS